MVKKEILLCKYNIDLKKSTQMNPLMYILLVKVHFFIHEFFSPPLTISGSLMKDEGNNEER